MSKEEIIGKQFNLDLGSLSPVSMIVRDMTKDKVIVEYLYSTPGRMEELKISEFESLAGIKINQTKTKMMNKKPPIEPIENIKIEDGVLIEYNGKYWGTVYSDGKSHTNGWVDIDKAELHDGRFLTKPEEATYKGSHETKELQKGRIVKVRKTTTIRYEF